MLNMEGPDIEVLDAILFVHIVQGCALAQRPAQKTTSISSGAAGVPCEQFSLCVSSQRSQSEQVSYLNPRQRPIGICTHAAILSQPAGLATAARDQRQIRMILRVARRKKLSARTSPGLPAAALAQRPREGAG